jgi:predicted hydrocarbon binding protein
MHGNTRAVIMPVGTVWSLWEGLEKILSPSGLAAVHYGAGKNTGAHTAKWLKEKYDLEKTGLISAFAEAMKATGWGIIEAQDINFNNPSGTIIVKECFEALAWRKKSFKACHWTRGLLAGFMSTVFGRMVEAIEVKCLATGDKNCEFKIQTKI